MNIDSKLADKRLNINLLSINSKTKRKVNDSFIWLAQAIKDDNHHLIGRAELTSNKYMIRQFVSTSIADNTTDVVLLSGGTGLTADDITLEAIEVLFDKPIEGFGELFRMLSYQEIGSSSIQSRAIAGIANRTLIIAIPSSLNACQLAWQHLISPQLNTDIKPCNFVSHLKSHNSMCCASEVPR